MLFGIDDAYVVVQYVAKVFGRRLADSMQQAAATMIGFRKLLIEGGFTEDVAEEIVLEMLRASIS